MIDIEPKYLDFILAVLQLHFPEGEVLAFGSRVDGSSREYSDLDLALSADGPVPLRVLGTVKEVLAASDLPFRVDIVDLGRVSPEFRRLIMANAEVLRSQVLQNSV